MFHSTFWAFLVSRNYTILRDIAPLTVIQKEIAFIQGLKLELRCKKQILKINYNILHLTYLIDRPPHADEAPLTNTKPKRQRWPAKPLISERSGTQYVAMVTKLV